MLKVSSCCSFVSLSFNYSTTFLPFVKAGVAGQEYPLTGIKRAHDHEHRGSKRPRCGECAIDAQPTFDLRGHIKAPFVVASILSHNKENVENFGFGRPIQGLSQCQGFECEPSAGTGDDERFVLNVSPVDYLALLELSGYSEYCGSNANHAL
jgi:hypothetical protein